MIDPRTVPILPTNERLPAVPEARLTPAALRQRFLTPPVWAPEIKWETGYSDVPPRHAAVLVPVVARDRLTLLLTQRPSHMRTHAGQIAFPGGKVDDGDVDVVAAALREAHEEVGLAPERVEVLGALPAYTTGSAFIITPVVGLVQEGFSLSPNPHEVAEAFEVPLQFLMDPAHHHRHAMELEGRLREWFSMPYPDPAGERFIWGATAGMLRNFYRFLSA